MESNVEAYKIRERVEWYLNKNTNKKIINREEVNNAFAIILHEVSTFYFTIIDHCRRINDPGEAESESGQSALEFLGLIRELSDLLSTLIEAPYTCEKCDSDVYLRHDDKYYLFTNFILWLFLDKNKQINRSLTEWEELVDWYIRPCLTYKCENKKCGFTEVICFVDGHRNEWGYTE